MRLEMRDCKVSMIINQGQQIVVEGPIEARFIHLFNIKIFPGGTYSNPAEVVITMGNKSMYEFKAQIDNAVTNHMTAIEGHIKYQLKFGGIKDKLSIDMIMDMYDIPEEIAKKIHNNVFPVERPCGVIEAESAQTLGKIVDDMKTRDIFSSISLSRAREIRENLVFTIKTSYHLTEEQAQNVFDLFYVDELEDTRPGNA